jgi:hypothetical protein
MFAVLRISRFTSVALVVWLGLCLILACDDDNPVQPTPVPENPMRIKNERATWTSASRPAQFAGSSQNGKLLWHIAEEVTIPLEYQNGSSVHPLRFVFRPGGFIFGDSARIAGRMAADVYAWNGVMTLIPSSARLAWYLVVKARSNGALMHIDVGRISEDIDGDMLLDTEDKDFNNYVQPEEDLGLDGLPDFLEPGYDALTNPDPNRDNWYFRGGGICPLSGASCPGSLFDEPTDLLYYEFLNGTEGNLYDVAVPPLPDQEQLSPEVFDVTNAYCSYSIDFTSERFLQPDSAVDGWNTYFIPLLDEAAMDTVISDQGLVPAWWLKRHIRIWFSSETPEARPPDTVLISDMYFAEELY